MNRVPAGFENGSRAHISYALFLPGERLHHIRCQVPRVVCEAKCSCAGLPALDRSQLYSLV